MKLTVFLDGMWSVFAALASVAVMIGVLLFTFGAWAIGVATILKWMAG